MVFSPPVERERSTGKFRDDAECAAARYSAPNGAQRLPPFAILIRANRHFAAKGLRELRRRRKTSSARNFVDRQACAYQQSSRLFDLPQSNESCEREPLGSEELPANRMARQAYPFREFDDSRTLPNGKALVDVVIRLVYQGVDYDGS